MKHIKQGMAQTVILSGFIVTFVFMAVGYGAYLPWYPIKIGWIAAKRHMTKLTLAVRQLRQGE